MTIADAGRGLSHLFVHDLVLPARIGVHAHEQQAPQRVRLSLDLAVIDPGRAPAGLAEVVDYAALTGRVRRLLTAGHVDLVEQLAERIARLCLEDPRVRSARIRVEKLDAIADCAAVGVEIERRNPRPCGQRDTAASAASSSSSAAASRRSAVSKPSLKRV